MHESEGPSDIARALVRGAYDLHVHVAPDLIARRIDDVTLARRFADLGLGGFVLKSHYVPTAERAAVVSALVPAVDVLGGIVLNSGVGGMNAIAVEIAARAGARIVWLPTFDARNETAGRRAPEPGVTLPVWARMQHDLRAQGVETPIVDVTTPDGAVTENTRAVLAAIARHRLVLATGHVSRAEVFAVVDAAVSSGIRDIVVTHPEFPSQALTAADQLDLVRKGALLERCFTTPHSGRVGWDTMVANIRATGPTNSFLSSDLGQLANPPVEDGLALFADRLLAAGLGHDEVYAMAVLNTRRIAGAASPPPVGNAGPAASPA